MKRIFLIIAFFAIAFLQAISQNPQPDIIRKGNLVYDFTFVQSALKFIRTGDSSILVSIAKDDAAKLIFGHAKKFNYQVPQTSSLALVKYLLSDKKKNDEILTAVKRNIQYAKDSVAAKDIPQKECLKYLPEGFVFDSHLYFTYGYDRGVVFGSNAAVNLANPHYIENMREIRYYCIHELHHAGFVKLKNNFMPDINVRTYAEMTDVIAYYTQMEGMATYVAMARRQHDGAMNDDKDYAVLQDSALMQDYEAEFFQIYFWFLSNPDGRITDLDKDKLAILSDKKRLWYTVGAHMTQFIDKKLGRKKLTDLISEPSRNFISAYLENRDR